MRHFASPFAKPLTHSKANVNINLPDSTQVVFDSKNILKNKSVIPGVKRERLTHTEETALPLTCIFATVEALNFFFYRTDISNTRYPKINLHSVQKQHRFVLVSET